MNLAFQDIDAEFKTALSDGRRPLVMLRHFSESVGRRRARAREPTTKSLAPSQKVEVG